MTADDFRGMALSLPDVVESSHMDHPDFRNRGGIFATLAYPTSEWGRVRLTAEEQARLTEAEPEVFVPVNGAWGRGGATQVFLRLAREHSVREALRVAWQNRLPKVGAPRKKPVLQKAPTRWIHSGS